MNVRAELDFDSIRVFINDRLHIDVRRSTYRAMQAWKWSGNYKIEFSVADAKPMLVEYEEQDLWLAVLEELAKLPLSGE